MSKSNLTFDVNPRRTQVELLLVDDYIFCCSLNDGLTEKRGCDKAKEIFLLT